MKQSYKTARSLAAWLPLIVTLGIPVPVANDFSTASHAHRRASRNQQPTVVSCGVPSFAPLTNLNAGTLPVGLVAGNFNADAKVDLVVANFSSNNLSIFLNNGSGGFGAPGNHPAGPFPSSLVAADFNGDGRVDLAITDADADDVSILFGNGNGNFGLPLRFSVGANPSAIVAGDFNGDGRVDLAVANADTNDVSILLGNGAGNFTTMPGIPVGASPLALAAGDFNGDGKTDLAVADFVDGDVSILLGNGSGGFVKSLNLTTGADPISVVVGDFNGDGKADIAVADSSADDIAVFSGDGAGGFAAANFYGVGTDPQAIAKGDFNGDGKLDLAVANGGSQDVSVLLNNGAAGFQAPVNFSVGLTILHNTCGAALPTIQFSSTTYTVNESQPHVDITLFRSGDTSTAASVKYATNDSAGLTNCNVFNGIASPRCDYENTQGTMNFAAGETSKSFSVAIVDDSYAEGNETFTIGLNNPAGATLGAQSTATVTITDNDSSNGPNPIDNTNFFVRQQYIDFLGREPDPPGFAGWTSTINNCAPGDTNCDRIHVSQLVPDLASVSGFLDANQLEAAKVAFVADFMKRSAFTSTYDALTNQQYVDALLNTAGVTVSTRQSMIDGLDNATMTRGQVLRQIVESTEVSTKYNHQAYAVMEYFGYLRRQPDSFYLQWIAVLDATNDPRGMVTGFATSQEYRSRFGP